MCARTLDIGGIVDSQRLRRVVVVAFLFFAHVDAAAAQKSWAWSSGKSVPSPCQEWTSESATSGRTGDAVWMAWDTGRVADRVFLWPRGTAGVPVPSRGGLTEIQIDSTEQMRLRLRSQCGLRPGEWCEVPQTVEVQAGSSTVQTLWAQRFDLGVEGWNQAYEVQRRPDRFEVRPVREPRRAAVVVTGLDPDEVACLSTKAGAALGQMRSGEEREALLPEPGIEVSVWTKRGIVESSLRAGRNTIALAPARTFRVEVVAATGTPVDALVWAAGAPQSAHWTSDGAADVVARPRSILWIAAPGAAPQQMSLARSPQVVVLQDREIGGDETFDLSLLDAEGRPISGAQIFLERMPEAPLTVNGVPFYEDLLATTDESGVGRVLLESDLASPQAVVFRARGFRELKGPIDEIRAGAREFFAEPFRRLELFVVGEDGPIESAQIVKAEGGRVHATDEAGRLSLDVAAGDVREYRVESPGYRGTLVRVVPEDVGSTEVEVRLERAATLHARFTDARTGEAVSKVFVVIQDRTDGKPIEESSFPMVPVASSNEEGLAWISGVEPVEYLLQAHHERYEAQEVRLRADDWIPGREPRWGHEVVELEPLETGSVRGAVRDGLGAPIDGAFVSGRSASPSRKYSARTGEVGEFVLERVASGRLKLRVGHAEWLETEVEVDVRAGLETGIDVVLSAGATISGRVVGADEALGRVAVKARRLDARGSHWAQIDLLSRYELRGLADGSWVLGVNAPRGVTADEVRVEIRDGIGATGVDLQLRKSGTRP